MANAWNKVGNMRGPQGQAGPQGDAGPAGANGRSNRVANIDVGSNTDVALSAIFPSDNVIVGDVIADAKGELYTVTGVDTAASTVHVSDVIKDADGNVISTKGPKGDKGDAGADGKDGTGVNIKGSVDAEGDLPTEGNVAGDAYLVGGDLYVWGGSSWTNAGSIKGPKGDKGDTGATGAAGAKGDTGAAGPQGPQGAGIAVGVTDPTDAPAGGVGSSYVNAATGDLFVYGEAGA